MLDNSLPAPDLATHLQPSTIKNLLSDAYAGVKIWPESSIKTRWTAAELFVAVFPEPTWLVPNRIPTGLIVLGGRPKVGKSWWGLQLAIAKGSGGRMFGEKLFRGRVLYLAFEDSPRRLQARMAKQHASRRRGNRDGLRTPPLRSSDPCQLL